MYDPPEALTEWWGLVRSLPGGTILRLVMQDYGYDRSLVKWASPSSPDQTLGEHALAQIECVLVKDR